jgi:hypothetical protein
MSFGSYSREDDYLKNFRERFNEIKKSQVSSSSKQGLNSLDRIAEFRKKLESSFNTRSEQSSKLLVDDSFKSYSKDIIPEIKQCPSPKRYHGFSSFCKSPSNGSSFIQKDKLEDVIPLETLTEAKNALISASEESLKDLPYLYTFTLTRLSKSFCEKYEKNFK